VTPRGEFIQAQRSREQEFDETRVRVRALEERLERHFKAVALNERQRGRYIPRHDYGEAPWCAPDALEGFWRSLAAEIAGVAAEGPPVTLSVFTANALHRVTGSVAVELMALDLRDPAIHRRYAEWVFEALTTPAVKLSPSRSAPSTADDRATSKRGQKSRPGRSTEAELIP